MAAVDPVFRNIPKSSTQFITWRVENMQLVPVPKDHLGSFFAGDSYLVLCITEYGEPGSSDSPAKETKKGLEIHIHFWLGEETSNDEAGVAAYKAVELDDSFGGTAVQHREVQGHESKRFVSYFKNGLKIMNGGAASGFHHVTDEIHQRMFGVKGKRKPLIRERPGIEWQYMNDGDVFVLDLQHALFVWCGKNANRAEKLAGAKVAQSLKDDRDRPIIIVEDGEEPKLPNTEKQYFNQFLPLNAKSVKSSSETITDESVEQKAITDIKLYRCTDEDGTLKVTEVKSGPLHQVDLTSQDSYIIDNGEGGIWVWVGKKASQKERVEAMRNAQGFSKKKGYPNHTPVTRIIDGGEPVEFKSLFRTWKDKNQTEGLGKANTRGNIAKTVQSKFDAQTLHENTKLAAQSQMVDDGSGAKEVWRVENFDLVPLDPKEYGHFYDGDSYVIMYRYEANGTENMIIYYWLGNQSTADEKGTAALKTIELDDNNAGKAVQVRVVQGKEPAQLMAIFGGRIVIYHGGKASGFHSIHQKDATSSSSYLLQVRGNLNSHVRAVEVEKRAASLNSNDVFVLCAPSMTYIWAGKGSTGDEREMAKEIANLATKEPVMISEGQEKQDFWDAIGGKEPYSANKRLQEEEKDHRARLFQCSNASGRFNVEEIYDFNQSDLLEDDVMLLDAWEYIFLWLGQHSNVDERKFSEEAALEYLKTDPGKRDEGTSIVRIKQGYEPPTFTGFFGTWDRALWSNNKTYEELKQELHDNNPGLSIVSVAATNGFQTDTFPRHPLSDLLQKDADKLPEGVNPLMKELYLSNEEFSQVFGVDRESYDNMPQWKQHNLKKKAGLF